MVKTDLFLKLNKSARDIAFDNLKSIAIFLVVLGHFFEIINYPITQVLYKIIYKKGAPIMGENKTPAYTRRAIDKYLDKLESKTVRFPKGTTARIKAQGQSVNGFVNNLVLAELERLEQVLDSGPATNPLDEFNF